MVLSNSREGDTNLCDEHLPSFNSFIYSILQYNLITVKFCKHFKYNMFLLWWIIEILVKLVLGTPLHHLTYWSKSGLLLHVWAASNVFQFHARPFSLANWRTGDAHQEPHRNKSPPVSHIGGLSAGEDIVKIRKLSIWIRAISNS